MVVCGGRNGIAGGGNDGGGAGRVIPFPLPRHPGF